MGSAVRIHQAIHTEVAVMRELPCIAAVMENISSVCSLAFPGRMITPFPYEAAAELVIFVHQLHVIMDIPGAVAHCMNKFTLNKGLSHSAVFAVFLYPLGIRIHPAHHIQHGNIVVITCGIIDACFIVQQTGRIISLYPSSGVLKVAAVAALIAQGPENNRALVFVPDHISLLTIENRLRPGIILRDVAHAIVTIICIQSSYAVAFQIRFRNHVKSVFTAQLREIRRIGIVAGTNRIDIAFLHQLQIADHVFPGHGCTGVRIGIVAVDAPEFHLFSID